MTVMQNIHSLLQQTCQMSSLSTQDQQEQTRVWKISLIFERLQWEGLQRNSEAPHPIKKKELLDEKHVELK